MQSLRERTGWLVTSVVAVAAVGADRPARAGTEPAAVVESYEGERPADAAALLAPVYAELGQRGYLAGDALATRVRDRLSGDPGKLTPGQLVAAQKDVERGYQGFIDGDYAAASTAVERALAVYGSAPAILSHEDALRGLQFKALLIAARSAEARGRNDDAFRWMAEAIRAFPAQRPAPADFDPMIVALHRRVSDELARQGGATLEIRVSDPAAVIFVDEHFVGTGHARLDKLPPGRYRVYVAKGEQPGRVHPVELAPHGSATVDVAWDVDGAVATGAGYVSVAAHGDDASGAVQLAHALGVGRVVVLGIRTVGGRRAVVGYGVEVESQTRSYAAVQIEPVPPPEETMRRLAALLAGDKDVSTSNLITREPSRAIVDGGGGMATRRKIALGVVAASVIAGGVALAFDVSAHSTYDQSTREGDDARQLALFDSSNSKYHLAQGLAVVGAIGVAAAVALWFTAPSESEAQMAIAPAPSPDGMSVVLSGRF